MSNYLDGETRIAVMEREWRNGKFSSHNQFVATLKKCEEFFSFAESTLSIYASGYLNSIGANFGISKLSKDTQDARIQAADMAMLNFQREREAASLWKIAKKLVGNPAFSGCKTEMSIRNWLQIHFKKVPVKHVRRKTIAEKPKLQQELTVDLDLAIASADFAKHQKLSTEIFSTLTSEVTRLQKEVAELKERDNYVAKAQVAVGEKEMELRELRAEFGKLQKTLMEVNEALAQLKVERRDPDEDLRYELREKNGEIAKLEEKVRVIAERSGILEADNANLRQRFFNADRHLVSSGIGE